MLAHRARLVRFSLVLASVAAGPLLAQTPIYTVAGLDNVRNDLDGDYVLMADLNLASTAFSPIGSAADPFTGTFAGNGHAIAGFTFTGTISNVGLFGYTLGASISGVTMRGANVFGNANVGALVGQAVDSTISSCGIESANVDGIMATGGLAGRVGGSTVEACKSAASTHVYDRWSGSLIGHIHIGSTVRNCGATGNVTGGNVIGGLSGNVHGSVVENCQASGKVSGALVCGGLTGWMQEDLTADPPVGSTLTGCRASGPVESAGAGLVMFTDPFGHLFIAVSSDGGLVGWVDDFGTIVDCTASGSVDGQTLGDDITCGGLIGFASADCLVQRCHATGNVHGGSTCGGLAGWAQDDTQILDCTAHGRVDGEWESGGLVGAAERAYIADCHAYGDCTAPGVPNTHVPNHLVAALGGLVGYTFPSSSVDYGTRIERSSAHGSVSSDGQFTGGLVGLCWGAEVAECYSTGNVTSSEQRVGGLVGATPSVGTTSGSAHKKSKIADCYATGTVLQIGAVPANQGLAGGLLGYLEATSGIPNHVHHCYSIGSVTAGGAGVGGLIGKRDASSLVHSSYWDLQTSGQDTSDGGDGKTTAQMMMQSTFVDWLFPQVWSIDTNPPSYPYLSWQ